MAPVPLGAASFVNSHARPDTRFSPDIRLRSARPDRSHEAVPSFLELRHIANYPTMNRRVRHHNAALGHHRHEIPIAQSVGDVLAYAQLDDLGIEPATSINGISVNRLGHLASRGRRNCTIRPLRHLASLDAAITRYRPLMQRNPPLSRLFKTQFGHTQFVLDTIWARSESM
jgi:hypothetical protein